MSKEVATPIRTIRIGSSTEADLVLADESIAPIHAELAVFSDSVFFLADLESPSGTFVSRHGCFERHEQGEVTAKDLVRFGEVALSMEEILSVFSISAADVFKQPAASAHVRRLKLRIPSRRTIQKHPRVILGTLVIFTGFAAWSYQSEWETYNSIESQLELARSRIQDRTGDSASKESLRALLSEAQDRAIVAHCFWSCGMKISLAEEGARLGALLGDTTAQAGAANSPTKVGGGA